MKNVYENGWLLNNSDPRSNDSTCITVHCHKAESWSLWNKNQELPLAFKSFPKFFFASSGQLFVNNLRIIQRKTFYVLVNLINERGYLLLMCHNHYSKTKDILHVLETNSRNLLDVSRLSKGDWYKLSEIACR